MKTRADGNVLQLYCIHGWEVASKKILASIRLAAEDPSAKRFEIVGKLSRKYSDFGANDSVSRELICKYFESFGFTNSDELWEKICEV